MKPLNGVTILDISRLLPGGYASLLLVGLGARVIKVEQPGIGDYYRGIPGAPALLGNQVDVINQGKESLGLDLKAKAGKEIFQKLVRKSDVVLESFRPGVLKKLGLDFRALRRVNPRIILCSITGFGQKGPQAQLAGHDLNFLGLSGLLGRVRAPSGQIVIPDFQVVDLAAGYEAAMRIGAALVERAKTKKGSHVDVSMKGAAVSLSRLYSGPTPLTGELPRYGVYETADGKWVTIGALEPKFWSKFCGAIGKPETVSREELETVFRSKTQVEWGLLGERVDVCLFPVQELPSTDRFCLKPFPPLGQQTARILQKLGYSSGEIRALKTKKIVE